MGTEKNQIEQTLNVIRVAQQLVQKQSESFAQSVYEAVESILSRDQAVSDASVIAEILYLANPQVANEVLESLSQTDSDLAQSVKEKLFSIEDIPRLDDRATQKVLKQTEMDVLSKAMKGVPQPVLDKILRNMSKRAAELLKEDMAAMGPIRAEDAREAQRLIERIVIELQTRGEIIIVAEQGKKDLVE